MSNQTELCTTKLEIGIYILSRKIFIYSPEYIHAIQQHKYFSWRIVFSGCVTQTFTIKSEDDFAYVSKSEKLVGYYPLEFKTEASSAASFCFTENNALMEVTTQFCIFGSDGDLTLVQNCNLQWMYDSNTKRLTTNGGRYLTPVVKTSGVVRLGLQSCCGDRSSMVFSKGKFLVSCFSFNI